MDISPIAFRDTVRERLLDLLWRQWSAIGVAGNVATAETMVVDPEALLLLTLTVGRYDARLYDAVLEWLDLNADYLNAQRLLDLAPHFGPHAQAGLAAIAERLGRRSAVALKWRTLSGLPGLAAGEPLFLRADGPALPLPAAREEAFARRGLDRAPFNARGVATRFPESGEPALLLRLRALLGVNFRCEVLCLLGATGEIHPSRIAQSIGLAPRTTQALLAGMARSGAVQARTSARAKYYALVPGVLDDLLRPQGPTPWRHSVPLFRALESVWLGLSNPQERDLAPALLASQWRRTARRIAPLLGDSGLGQPLRDDGAFPGEAYFAVYQEDIGRLLATV